MWIQQRGFMPYTITLLKLFDDSTAYSMQTEYLLGPMVYSVDPLVHKGHIALRTSQGMARFEQV